MVVSYHSLLTFCSPAESLDETTEQKDGNPPEHPAAPSTPVKLEEGELWAGGWRSCPDAGGRMALCGRMSMAGDGRVDCVFRSVEGWQLTLTRTRALAWEPAQLVVLGPRLLCSFLALSWVI